MSALLSHEKHVAGTVKFEASVPIEKLISLICEMKSSHPERWVDIHIRSEGHGGLEIAFHYILPDAEDETYTRMVSSFFEYLRHRLGTRPTMGTKADRQPLGVAGFHITLVKAMA